jgi:hypothetical protein
MPSLPPKRAAPIVCTGASPQRYSYAKSQLRDLLISPPWGGGINGERGTYLVVEATLMIEVIEERRVGLSAPQVHICNLKVIED